MEPLVDISKASAAIKLEWIECLRRWCSVTWAGNIGDAETNAPYMKRQKVIFATLVECILESDWMRKSDYDFIMSRVKIGRGINPGVRFVCECVYGEEVDVHVNTTRHRGQIE